jgi:hypothetical protein
MAAIDTDKDGHAIPVDPEFVAWLVLYLQQRRKTREQDIEDEDGA